MRRWFSYIQSEYPMYDSPIAARSMTLPLLGVTWSAFLMSQKSDAVSFRLGLTSCQHHLFQLKVLTKATQQKNKNKSSSQRSPQDYGSAVRSAVRLVVRELHFSELLVVR
jgi:hypothetical protein